MRDVTRDYSPALASILVDENIEVEEDFTAVILYLCSKGYLTMEKAEQENTFFFHIKDDDISKLSSHEKYILDCAVGKRHLDKLTLKELIVEDGKKLGLLEDGFRKPNILKIMVPYLFGFVLLIILNIMIGGKIFDTLFAIYMVLFIAIIIGLIAWIIMHANDKYFLTEKGFREAKEWKKSKKFFHDYTLISEKNMDYVKILDEYMAYGVALKETNQILRTIKLDPVYRSFLSRTKGTYIFK